MTELPNIEENSSPSLLLQDYYREYHVGGTTLVRVHAPYNIILEFLKERGYKEATLAENAQFRIQAGRDSGLSRHGNWVKEDILYIPRKGAFLTKNPATSKSPEKAAQAHKNGKEFYPTEKQVEEALEDSIQIYDAGLYHAGNIPINKFGSNETTVYAFGTTNSRDTEKDTRDAQNYGNFIRREGIEKMILMLEDEEYVNRQRKPFIRKLFFKDIIWASVLFDCGKDLHRCSLVGVPDKRRLNISD